MRSRPHALTEWFENSATRAQGTIVSAVADLPPAVGISVRAEPPTSSKFYGTLVIRQSRNRGMPGRRP
jgi:hypothetical protein